MRRTAASWFLSLFICASAASADALLPPTTDSYVWSNGETRAFELTWSGTEAAFTVDGLGTSVYGSLEDCCTDVFDRVREVHPGATLTFTDLAINTMLVNTVFVDNLNLSMLKQGALDNLALLTGNVTMKWDDPYARMARLDFNAAWVMSMGPVPGEPDANFVLGENVPEVAVVVPEPATLMLVGVGLLFAARSARRRTPLSAAGELKRLVVRF